MHLALYQPDIPQNTGAVLRTCACLGVAAHIIEPCGFVWSEKSMRRAGMDYLQTVVLTRHASWSRFLAGESADRLVLLTTKGSARLDEFSFKPGDVLLFGRESGGAPEEVHAAADERVRIPMAPGMRSLNLAASAAMVLGEALRQTSAFPPEE